MLLKKSERYVKTDMIYVAKGGSWLSLGQGTATVLGFILTIGFANLLPSNVFGTYKFVLSVAAIISVFSLTGTGSAITRAVARGYEGVLKDGFRMSFLWGLGMVGLGIAGAFYYFLNDNFILATSLLIVGSALPLTKSAELFDNFLVGKKDFRIKTTYGITRTSISIGSLLLTILFTNNPVIIIAVYFGSNLLTALFFYRRVLNKYRPKNTPDPLLKHYSKHLSAMKVLRALGNQVDKILVFHFLGATQLAIYSFARAPMSVLRTPTKPIGALLFPKLSEKSIPEIKRSLPRKIAIVFVLFTAIAILYIVTAPYIFQLLFSQYMESVLFSQVLAVSLLVAPAIFFRQTLLAHMKKKELYIIDIVFPLLKIVLFLILLPLYGIWGIVITLMGTRFLEFITLMWMFKKL